LVKRCLTKNNFIESLREAALTTAMVFTLLIGANILGHFMIMSHIPESLSRWIINSGINRYLVLSIICIIYIILGCLMEGMAIMVLTLPVIFPLVLQMGFDPVWFGVMVTLFIEVGLIVPPLGLNVIAVSGIAKNISMSTIFRGIVPFSIGIAVCVIILIIFPQIALFLPQTMGP
jgi:TRAP-type C4-dicarboxylate transport system permease large subunit